MKTKDAIVLKNFVNVKATEYNETTIGFIVLAIKIKSISKYNIHKNDVNKELKARPFNFK